MDHKLGTGATWWPCPHAALATTPSGQLLSQALSASSQKACVMKRLLSASKARAGSVSPKVLLIHNLDPFFIFKIRIIVLSYSIQTLD